jgi:type I restriction enzyme S subunit
MAGKYKAYPEYRDSGVEWLGEVPSDWDVWKWKHTLLSPMAYGANEAALDDDVKNPRYIRITDMNSDGSLRDDTFKSLPLEAAKNHLLKDGDILVARTGATVGKSFLYKDKLGAACFAGYLIRARINKNIVDPEFVSWYLQSDQYWKYISSSQIQATLQNVSAEKYGDMEIAIPSKKQDRLSIVNFLDHETAKIDTLIEKQQQLIQLLKEKRQAVISHAVTKGLNPDVPMKDSGVEWLGEVPEHWDIGKIKNLSLVISKGTTPSTMGAEFESSGIRFLKAENIGKGFYAVPQPEFYISKQTDEQLARSRLQDKDVLVIIAGATTGQASLITEELLPANTNQAVSFIRPLNPIYSEYISYWLSTEYAQSNIWQNAVQAAQPNLSMETLGNIHIPVPPEKEVENLVLDVQKQLLKFVEVIENAEQAIQLMQERRTALISAAVTGKIDVRLHASHPTGSA